MRVVPEAVTAVAMRFLEAFICSSRRTRSSIRSWASSTRAASIAPAGSRPARTSSQRTECNRQATLLRRRPRSLLRLAQTRSTAAWSSAPTSFTPRERSAATAIERASLGSFLFDLPLCSSRTRAASFGWTSTTRSPAETSCWREGSRGLPHPRWPRCARRRALPSPRADASGRHSHGSRAR